MNAVHLDFKGALPALPQLFGWLAFWRESGYDGIVLEYDDRIDWRTFPGLRRGGLTPAEHAALLARCRELGFEIIPLIQVEGHLEWLLKHPVFEPLRENGTLSEFCPSNPAVAPLIKRWIDEVAALHPDSRLIHLGADETWHLGSCPACRRRAETDSRGKLGVYLDHVGEMCRYALSRHLRPMIWADMFLRDGNSGLAAELPSETILVDWQYNDMPPYPGTAKLVVGGREVWGASGALIGYHEHCSRILGNPQSRIDNTAGWFGELRHGKVSGVIHTAWGRGSSLWSIYGSWHAAYPAFIAGGDPACWETHPWRGFMRELSGVIDRNMPPELEKAAEEVLALPAATELEWQVLRYYHLALRYQGILTLLYIERCSAAVTAETGEAIWAERKPGERYFKWDFAGIGERFDRWEAEMRAFWRENALSDEAEFFAARCNPVRRELEREMKTWQEREGLF